VNSAATVLAIIGGVIVVVGFVVGGAVAFYTYKDRRKADSAAVWKDLADARGQAEHDCLEKVTRLEGRVAVLEEDWLERLTDGIARAVAERVVTAMREDRR